MYPSEQNYKGPVCPAAQVSTEGPEEMSKGQCVQGSGRGGGGGDAHLVNELILGQGPEGEAAISGDGEELEAPLPLSRSPAHLPHRVCVLPCLRRGTVQGPAPLHTAPVLWRFHPIKPRPLLTLATMQNSSRNVMPLGALNLQEAANSRHALGSWRGLAWQCKETQQSQLGIVSAVMGSAALAAAQLYSVASGVLQGSRNQMLCSPQHEDPSHGPGITPGLQAANGRH